MNTTVLRGLFLDAYYQVVDNWVFRILLILTVGAVAISFAVGAGDATLNVLWWRFPYTEFGFSDNLLPGEASREIIGYLQTLVIDQIIGLFGLLMCLAATAFFVPNMLERGAADTLFSKPVSRTVLLVARYAAGLIFVTALAAVLVVGLYLGLTARSGLDDATLLWSAPVLVYRYAIVYSVTVLIGVLTRSSVAALLVSFLFIGFNGCVHLSWELRQTVVGRTDQMERLGSERSLRDAEREAARAARLERRNGANTAPAVTPAEPPAPEEPTATPEPVPAPETAVPTPEAATTAPAGRDAPGPFLRVLWRVLDAGHFVLPKPGEAPRIVELITKGDPDVADATARADFDARNAERVEKGLRPRTAPPGPPFDTRLRWGGPWQRNALVSILTSIGFAFVVFAAAAWRLTRIRF